MLLLDDNTTAVQLVCGRRRSVDDRMHCTLSHVSPPLQQQQLLLLLMAMLLYVVSSASSHIQFQGAFKTLECYL